MCGIFGTTGTQIDMTLVHRGPDESRIHKVKDVTLVFHRLAINNLDSSGMQPFEHNKKYLIANAEIYNHVDLGGLTGDSDCKVILPTIEKYGLVGACQILSGDFAFVVTDGDTIWAARDRVGVRPLFYCRHGTKGIAFASEAKALLQFQTKIEIFPPGHVYDSKLDAFVCYEPNYWDSFTRYTDTVEPELFRLLEESVARRIVTSDRPVGFFLSGGLDSSIIASLGKKILKDQKIKTFSIGLEGAPDLLAARTMA